MKAICEWMDALSASAPVSLPYEICSDDAATAVKWCGFWVAIACISFWGLYHIWQLLLTPTDWTRDLTAVGYNYITEKCKGDAARRAAINRARRSRFVGAKIPPPFPNGWFGVCEASDVKPGQAISISCLGQQFAIFRTQDGVAHVLDAHCPHLGANLGIGGIVRGDCIECPFHQWAFRGTDGICTNIPYSGTGTIPKSAKVKKWISQEVNDTIFVWHHVDEDVEPWTLPVVSQIESGQWHFHGRNEFLVSCHIQEIPENGADVAHLNVVHGPSMLSGSDIRHSRAAWASFGMHTWNATWRPGSPDIDPHIATMELKHSVRLFNKIELGEVDVSVKQVGPGYVQLFMKSTFGEFVVLQTVTPQEPLVQKVVHRFYGPLLNRIAVKFVIWGESIMFERDMMVWNHKCFVDNPCLIKEDRLIRAYRNWYSQFYSESSKSFGMARECLEW